MLYNNSASAINMNIRQQFSHQQTDSFMIHQLTYFMELAKVTIYNQQECRLSNRAVVKYLHLFTS